MQVGTGRLLVLSPTEETQAAATAGHLYSAMEQDGFRVHSVPSAEQFIPALDEFSPDLALVPVSLEGQSLVKEIVGIADHPPLMVVGGSDQGDLASEMIGDGADEYFLGEKLPLFRNLVKRTIEGHRSVEALQAETQFLRTRLKSMSMDHQAAFDVQQKLLPKPQIFGDIAFGYYLVPRSGMSGDSVNCFELKDGRLLFYLADVAGHGILGGVIATALTLTAKNLADPEFDAAGQASSDLLVWFNEALLALNLERHVAMFLGVVSKDRRSLEYSSAAHFPGTILCQEDHCLYLELGGLPLGVCETTYEARRVELSESFQLVLFSDGVLEILPQDSIENRENHLISLVESGSRSVGAIAKRLSLDGLIDVPDDIALLTIRRDFTVKDPAA